MIRIRLRGADEPAASARTRRQRFGLDAPLPSDPRIVERAILRHLAEERPDILVLALTPPPETPDAACHGARVDPAQGAPDLLLVRPGGGLAFLAIRAQAHRASRAERAFADLCRDRSVPFHVVRSLPEARRVLDRLGIPTCTEANNGKKAHLSRRPA